MATVTIKDERGLLNAQLTLDEATLRHPAIDVFFLVVGHERPEALVDQGVLRASDLEALQGLQRLLFDRDAEGLFVREGVAITANGRDLDPDAPLWDLCGASGCTLTIQAPQAPVEPSQADQVRVFAHMMLLHQTAAGHGLDVTKDYPGISFAIAEAEQKGQIEIDVPTATYKLTPIGKRTHQNWIDEAQDLIKRFDIYGDVIVDGNGTASFDTDMGEDLRVPMFELAGVDPFRARFLLGLNDGEWDGMPLWWDQAVDPDWYAEVFGPIESAPSVESLGHQKLERVRDQGATYLRSQGALS